MNKNRKIKLFLYVFMAILFASFVYIGVRDDVFLSFKSLIVNADDTIVSPEEVQTKNENKNKNPNVVAEDSYTKKILDSKNTIESILLVGVDSPDHANNPKEQKGVRTDTIMIANIDKENGEVNITSIPRDSRVIIDGKYDKINHAHSYGGIKKLLEVIEENLGYSIDKYVKVDYKAIESITEDIGGVEVVIKEPMKYVDPTPNLGVNIDFEPGIYNLKGKEAVEFLRYRSDEGDLSRIKNQQYFIKQFIKKIYDIGIIKASRTIIDNSLKYVDTNLNLFEIFGLVNFSLNIDLNNIIIDTLEGYPKYINGISYYIIDLKK